MSQCTNMLVDGWDVTGENALECGADAPVMTEAGPMCRSCQIDSGLAVLEQHEVSPLWKLANQAAERELNARAKGVA